MDEEVDIILQQDSLEITEPLVADYVLPTASSTVLGGVKIGDNLSIDSNGHLSVPIASGSNVGLVKVGTGLSIDSEGALSSDGGYVLPQATKNTLGGVYVDDELNTSSLNPAQNSVISLAIDSVEDNLTDLFNEVDGLSDTVDDIDTTVDGLSTTVGNLGTTVTNQGNDISSISSVVDTQGNNITTMQGDIENLQIGLSEASQYVGELVVSSDIVTPYTELTTGTWTAGDITLTRRGYIGFIICNLEGSLTIPANDSVVLLDTATTMSVASAGIMTDGSSIIETQVNTAGELIIVNNSASSITLTRIIGNIPIIISNSNES